MNNGIEQNGHASPNDSSAEVVYTKPTCPDRTWCDMAKHPEEHEVFHASDLIYLAGSSPETVEQGWWCWLVEDHDGTRFDLNLEGRVDGKSFAATMAAADVAMLLLSIETPAALTALDDLIEQAKA